MAGGFGGLACHLFYWTYRSLDCAWITCRGMFHNWFLWALVSVSQETLLGSSNPNWRHKQQPWGVLGDFNEVLYAFEMDSTQPRPSLEVQTFRQTIDALQLTEICLENTTFTWWNQRTSAAFVHAKLDRCFGNPSFLTVASTAIARALSMTTSDHHVIKLFVALRQLTSTRRGFTRLEPWWFQFPAVASLVVDN